MLALKKYVQYPITELRLLLSPKISGGHSRAHVHTKDTYIYIYIFVYVCTVYAHMYRYALELLDLGQTEPGSAIVKVQSSQAHSTRSLCSLAGRASPKQL